MALTVPLMRRLATHWRLRSDTSGMAPPSPQKATRGSEEGEEDLGRGGVGGQVRVRAAKLRE